MMDDVATLETVEKRMRPRLVSNFLLWTVLAFCAAFIIWASLTKIDRTVRGQGRVIPSSQLQVVSNLEGGIVDDILVKTGDTVAAGAPLMQLSPVIGSAELGSGQASVESLLVKVARLEAEITGRSPSFGSYNNPTMQSQIEVERALYRARQAEISSIRSAANARTEQARRAMAEAQATLAARRSVQRQAQDELGLIRPLVEQGYEPRMTLTKAESQAATASSEVAAASAAVSRSMAAISEANADYARQMQDWRSRAATELATARTELDARRQMLPALTDRVRRTTILAPVAGRINRVFMTTRGSSAAPGSPLVEIVPSEDNLLVEALVNPRDIGTVKIDQPATVSITAYDSGVYGKLKGKVAGISPDAIINERTGESHYLVRVRTSANALVTASGQRLAIGPGMTAEVDLLGDKRTVMSYFFSPVTKMANEAFRE
jgi:adhesin transport system membrane fusion protein